MAFWFSKYFQGLFLFIIWKKKIWLEPYLVRFTSSQSLNNGCSTSISQMKQIVAQKQNIICEKCTCNLIGDAFHYLIVCTNIAEAWKQFNPQYYIETLRNKNKNVQNVLIICYTEIISKSMFLFKNEIGIFLIGNSKACDLSIPMWSPPNISMC